MALRGGARVAAWSLRAAVGPVFGALWCEVGKHSRAGCEVMQKGPKRSGPCGVLCGGN